MKICWISDFDIRGSGYKNISIPICDGLTKLGHEVKASALGYSNQEHPYDFSMLAARNLRETAAIAQNLNNVWGFDVFIIALDIPIQEQYIRMMDDRQFKYAGIMPIEADPLCQSWAMTLMQMDQRFFISNFAVDEAKKVGVDGIHLPVGIDVKSWDIPKAEQKVEIRKSLGLPEDSFVVLTVADNQERKHLSAGIEIFSKFYLANKDSNAYYVLVTREHSLVGWKLRDLAQYFGVNDRVMVYERGITHTQLWSMYAMSDLFLLPSKAEGLGIPLLEAMSVGVPCMATDCTGMRELLKDSRGILIPSAYSYIDPFGNGNRYLIDVDRAVEMLTSSWLALDNPNSTYLPDIVSNARKFVEKRTWNKAVKVMEAGLLEMLK